MSLFSSRPASTASENDSEVEPQRFFNFLQHYGLQRYHGHLRDIGVSRISHLKSVDDKDLELIGFSRSEMNRLRRKLDENFSVTGRLMVGVCSLCLALPGSRTYSQRKGVWRR